MDQNQGQGRPNNQNIEQPQNMVSLKPQVANISDPYDSIGLDEVSEGVSQREANIKEKNSEEGETMPGLLQLFTAPATQAPQAAYPPFHLPEHTGLLQSRIVSFHLTAERSHQFEMEPPT